MNNVMDDTVDLMYSMDGTVDSRQASPIVTMLLSSTSTIWGGLSTHVTEDNWYSKLFRAQKSLTLVPNSNISNNSNQDNQDQLEQLEQYNRHEELWNKYALLLNGNGINNSHHNSHPEYHPEEKTLSSIECSTCGRLYFFGDYKECDFCVRQPEIITCYSPKSLSATRNEIHTRLIPYLTSDPINIILSYCFLVSGRLCNGRFMFQKLPCLPSQSQALLAQNYLFSAPSLHMLPTRELHPPSICTYEDELFLTTNWSIEVFSVANGRFLRSYKMTDGVGGVDGVGGGGTPGGVPPTPGGVPNLLLPRRRIAIDHASGDIFISSSCPTSKWEFEDYRETNVEIIGVTDFSRKGGFQWRRDFLMDQYQEHSLLVLSDCLVSCNSRDDGYRRDPDSIKTLEFREKKTGYLIKKTLELGYMGNKKLLWTCDNSDANDVIICVPYQTGEGQEVHWRNDEDKDRKENWEVNENIKILDLTCCQGVIIALALSLSPEDNKYHQTLLMIDRLTRTSTKQILPFSMELICPTVHMNQKRQELFVCSYLQNSREFQMAHVGLTYQKFQGSLPSDFVIHVFK